MMTHLLGLGHSRIGFIYGVGQQDLATNRMAVYKETMTSAGIPVDPSLIDHCGVGFQDGYQERCACWTARPGPPRW